jgi:hypothetical protein
MILKKINCNMMKKIFYLILLLFLVSCNSLSKKENETQMNQYQEERIDSKNKEFEFLCELVSYKTCISQDTVMLVAKEFYTQYGDAVFEGNKIVDEQYRSSELSNYNFIATVIKQYHLPRKEVFLIFSEIDLLYRLDNLEDNVSYMEDMIYNISKKVRADDY